MPPKNVLAMLTLRKNYPTKETTENTTKNINKSNKNDPFEALYLYIADSVYIDLIIYIL